MTNGAIWKTRLTHGAFGLTVLLSAARVGHAQQAESPKAGERVRVVTDYSGRREVLAEGTLVRLGADTVVITSALTRPDTTAIAVGQGRALQVWRGSRGHAARGALIGALVGSILVVASPCDESGGIGTFDCKTQTALGLVVVGGAGAGLGALIGAAARAKRWVGVSAR